MNSERLAVNIIDMAIRQGWIAASVAERAAQVQAVKLLIDGEMRNAVRMQPSRVR